MSGEIHEVIVTTLNEKDEPHSAPMGINKVGNHFQIKPFKPSSSYDNLRRTRCCTISYTDDVRIFAGAVSGHRDWPTLPASEIQGAYLQAALAHSEVKIIALDDAEPRAIFTGKVVYEQNHAPFRGYNRAQNAVIEAAILVSRLGILPEQKIRQEMDYLTIVIDKTAGERERQAWDWLVKKIRQTGIELKS